MAALVLCITSACTRSYRHSYADRRAQLAYVAHGLVQAENSIYHQYGHYSLNPTIDIYPGNQALANRAAQNDTVVTVTDASALPCHSILITIKITPVGKVQDTATFDLVLRDGVTETVSCRGATHYGCHNGSWKP